MSGFQIGAFQDSFQSDGTAQLDEFGAVMFSIAPYRAIFNIARLSKTFVIRR